MRAYLVQRVHKPILLLAAWVIIVSSCGFTAAVDADVPWEADYFTPDEEATLDAYEDTVEDYSSIEYDQLEGVKSLASIHRDRFTARSTPTTPYGPEWLNESVHQIDIASAASCATGSTGFVPAPTTSYECRIRSWFPGVIRALVCSGFVLDELHVATAGHCLYNPDYNGNAIRTKVFCYGVQSDGLRHVVTDQWRTSTNSPSRFRFDASDAGVIRLTTPLPVSAQPITEQCVSADAVFIAGYPGEVQPPDFAPLNCVGTTTKVVFTTTGTLTCSSSRGGLMTHTASCCQGMSGAAVSSTTMFAYVGMHTSHTKLKQDSMTCTCFAVQLLVGPVTASDQGFPVSQMISSMI